MNPIPDAVTYILLVEDNPVDVRVMRFALEKESAWPTVITVAEDAEKAIYLLSQSLTLDSPPDFIVLDLNLPKRDGTELLQWIRSTERLKHIPVAIVSSSPVDVIQNKLSAGSVEANGCFVKPMEAGVYFGLAKKLHSCYQQAAQSESRG